MQNAFVESFNDKFRSECLNVNWFLDPEDARRQVDAWRRDYNHDRPHSSLGRIPPVEFARRHRSSPVASGDLRPAVV